MSYNIEIRPASKNGYFLPDEARAYYGRYDRHGITWHWWGDGTGASNHDNIVNYMLRGAEAGEKSVNYVLSDNKITYLVNPDNVAWTSQSGNPVSVSVECQPTLGAEGYKKAGWLAKELAERYNGDRTYYPHNYWFGTQCPGTISLDRIRQEEDKWQRGEYNAVDPVPPPLPIWQFVPQVGKATVTGTVGDGLYVLEEPKLTSAPVTTVNEGTVMEFVGYVINGDAVNGITKWWKNAYGNYFSAAYALENVSPPPVQEPVVEAISARVLYTLPNAKLVNIKDLSVVKPFDVDTPMLIAAKTTWNGKEFYLTKSAYDQNRLQGFLVGDLKETLTPPPISEPEKPEWEKNLHDQDDTEYWFKQDTKLIDITTGNPARNSKGEEIIFKKDSSFVSSAWTIANGKEYRITDYSFKKGIFNGIQTSDLTLTKPGVPNIPPVIHDPNLVDKNVVITFLEMLGKLISDFIAKLRG